MCVCVCTYLLITSVSKNIRILKDNLEHNLKSL